MQPFPVKKPAERANERSNDVGSCDHTSFGLGGLLSAEKIPSIKVDSGIRSLYPLSTLSCLFPIDLPDPFGLIEVTFLRHRAMLMIDGSRRVSVFAFLALIIIHLCG